MSRKLGRATVRVHYVPEHDPHVRRQRRLRLNPIPWDRLSTAERQERARWGSRVGVTKPTIGARKAKRKRRKGSR